MIASASRYVEEYLPIHITSVRPACRCVVLWAAANREGDEWAVEHGTIPVLSIETQVCQVYSHSRFPDGHCPAEGASHAEMLGLGWTFERTEVRRRALIFSDQWQLVTSADDDFGLVSNVAYQLVPCPWPRRGDRAKFSPIRLQLANKAIQKTREREEKQRGAARL